MAYCKLNGITLPVAVDGLEEEPLLIETSERMEDASLYVDRRAEKGRWKMKLVAQRAQWADAFRRLIHGDGHYWGFDATPPGVYSSKGLGPSAATNATVTSGSSWLGAGRLVLTASSGTITFTALPLASTLGWTVMFARRLGANPWAHVIIRATGGNIYVDGVDSGSNLPASWGVTVNTTNGTVKLDADAGSTTGIDELIILPYVVPADWLAQIYAFQNPAGGNTQWAGLRHLKMQGDCISDQVTSGVATKTVIGRVGGASTMHSKSSGSKVALRLLDVSLEEV